MTTPLKVLIVEDSPNDADLLIAALQSAGYAPQAKRVETETDFLAELKNRPDIILSDYSLPRFNGLKAAELLQKSGLNIPFILISGTVGEEVAVEAMRQGAADYLLKDRLARLGSAVDRALEQQRLREERRRDESSLLLFRTLIDRSNDAFEVTDPETGRFLDVNETACQRLGYQRSELLALNVTDIETSAVDAAAWTRFVEEIRRDGGKIFEGRQKRKDGSTFPVEVNVRHVRLDREYLVAAVRDITERRQAEQALLATEERFRQLAENINEVFWITDPTMHELFYVSPAYEKIWGRSCNSLYAAPLEWQQAIHPEDRPRIAQAAADVPTTGAYDVEYRILRPNKTEVWIHDRGFPVRNAAGEVYRIVGTAEDITARKKLEEQFRQAQKMEGIGQLAGGVAHDFNNMLMIIQMQVDLLVGGGGGLSAVQSEFVDEIRTTVRRAADLTRQLLLFSRREVFRPGDLDLGESLANTTKMLRPILGEDIQMQLKLPSQPMLIHADAGMMDQILLNLVVNARDAMPRGGQIIIEVAGAVIDPPAAAEFVPRRPGSFVCLSVGDNGSGIPPEVLPKIFEPFFTTKDVGKGTGLGLATVFGIVQQHEGWIEVASEVGRGTTFRIYIPRLARHTSAAVAPANTGARGGQEMILLVEDDPTLRISMRRALAQLGYRIVEASTGVKALEVWKANRADIRLLLTDLVMPDNMTGKELAEALLAENPRLKVICMSGYSAEVTGRDFPLNTGVNFLTKPFPAGKLAQTVRQCLDAESKG